jgi:hypothetical protein
LKSSEERKSEMRVILLLSLFLSTIFGQAIVLLVPAAPLTGPGLATPYLNNFNQSIAVNAAFVQGAWFDPNTNTIAGYNPLVITMGTKPAVPPTAVTLPGGAVVGLWFGINGNTLTLSDNNNGANVLAGACVNGITNSIFGQFAYCNAPAFFMAANAAITQGTLKVPALGMANDGQICPTTHDFFVVDMDQSDNVITSYLITTQQLIAQGTQTNINNLGMAVVGTLTNGSDLRLMGVALAGALGCPQWTVRDMAEVAVTNMIPVFGTVELQATLLQQPPIALVPVTHAMTRVNNQPSLTKTNAYRAGCGQPAAGSVNQADGLTYCNNIYFTAPARLLKNEGPFTDLTSPDMNAASNLFAFLAQRFATTFGPDGLGCLSLLNVPPPVVPVMNMGGMFVGATITPPNPNGAGNTGLPTNTIIIIVVCTVVGGLLVIGLIIGVIWYRNRSMYS